MSKAAKKPKQLLLKKASFSKPQLLIFIIIFATIGGYAIYRSFAAGATYYIAANGSDSNNGISKSTPWLHVPGMTGCSAVCASTTPQPGNQYIVRGGDTWHYTGSGQSPTGLPWTWSPGPQYGWNGNAGAQIYIGFDNTWYNAATCGSSWCRPVLNGDNPLSTSVVSSCATPNDYILNNYASYVTFDNFEIRGFCMTGSGGAELFTMQYNTNHSKFLNMYIHGWTLDDPRYGQRLVFFQGATNGPVWPRTETEYAYNVFDGSDSSPRGGTILYGDCYNFHHNLMRYVVNFVCNNMHTMNNNVFEYFNDNASNGLDHSNTMEVNTESDENNYFYNNVVRHIGITAGMGVNIWFHVVNTDYAFNNLVYDIHSSGNFWNNDGNIALELYNNTVEISQNNYRIEKVTVSKNNHWITDFGSFWINNTPQVSGDLIQTHAVASNGGNGYTSPNQFAPTTAFHPTAGAGVNLSSLCSAVGVALCSDTNLGVGYDTTNHAVIVPAKAAVSRPSSGAWDIGAYQFSSTPPPTPIPGDLNSDGHVTITDLSILLSNYATTNTTADINHDGTVNILDLSILLSNYGT